MYSKKKIIEYYNLKRHQLINIDKFVQEIIKYNNHTNIVGKSTLLNPWQNHVLDSLQITNYIKNKKYSILDMGTGAGLPGIILSIVGCSNVSLIDSNLKKITFVQHVNNKLDLNVKIYLKRIENLKYTKFDILVSRALANLSNLFFYSQYFLKKKTVMIFLKGKTVKQELEQAKISWNFFYEIHKSQSDKRGSVLVINNLTKKYD